MAVTTYSLDFTIRHSYASQSAITLPITLISDLSIYVDLLAKMDTGSTFCIFERRYADLLKLNLTAGIPQKVSTAMGTFQSYGHDVALSVFDFEWQAIVYFAEPESFSLNVLGRVGFLDRVRLGILDYEELLYLGLDEQP